MRLTITLPDSARVHIGDDDRGDEPAPTSPPTSSPGRYFFGELAAPADVDRTTPLDCLVSDGHIAYRVREYADTNGVEGMPGGGYLVAYADRRGGCWWVQTNPDDGGAAYLNATEAHARIRSVWTGPVQVFSTYEGSMS